MQKEGLSWKFPRVFGLMDCIPQYNGAGLDKIARVKIICKLGHMSVTFMSVMMENSRDEKTDIFDWRTSIVTTKSYLLGCAENK